MVFFRGLCVLDGFFCFTAVVVYLPQNGFSNALEMAGLITRKTDENLVYDFSSRKYYFLETQKLHQLYIFVQIEI